MIEIKLAVRLTKTECIAELSCKKRDGTDHKREYSCPRYEADSIHRAELKAVAAGLREIRYAARVVIYLKTSHSVAAINQDWIKSWRENGWKNKKGTLVRDWEIWREIMDIANQKELLLEGAAIEHC